MALSSSLAGRSLSLENSRVQEMRQMVVRTAMFASTPLRLEIQGWLCMMYLRPLNSASMCILAE